VQLIRWHQFDLSAQEVDPVRRVSSRAIAPSKIAAGQPGKQCPSD
jgi:hypothetical protein